jgi:small subunit ribosomal protein S13
MPDEKESSTQKAPKGKGQEAPKEGPAPRAKDAAAKKPKGAKEDFRYIVRIANTDLNGARPVVVALTGVKGVGTRFAEVVAGLAKVPRQEPIGNLDDAQIESLEKAIAAAAEEIPEWMVNRPHDPDTGVDLHVFGPEVDTYRRNDINRLRMIRSYRGIRHETGQKVRGQRTRSNGRTGLTVGVTKKAAQAAAAAKKSEGKKE